MYFVRTVISLGLFTAAAAGADQPVKIQFKAVVGSEDFACGRSYPGIGTTKSTISPKDFRFYVQDVRLIDESGAAVAVELKQDERWQLDNLALLDFENGAGGCSNGTPDMNTSIVGAVPAGQYRGLRFTLGVPFDKNHTELTKMPPPLNLTALNWVWNAGRKFARLDFSSTGLPRGFAVHLGSTGCTPNETKTTVPTSCGSPNRVEVTFARFDAAKDTVLADLAALLKDSNVDLPGKEMSGCMSSPRTPACGPIFSNLGLPFPGQETGGQVFFRKSGKEGAARSASR